MKGIFLIILLIYTHAGVAQDKQEWTLQECVNYALKNNISVKRSSLSVTQEQAALSQSKAALLPSLNGRASHTYNFGQNEDPTSGIIIDLDSRSNTLGVGADVTLFDGFSNYNRIKQNNLFLEASLADLEQARNDIGLNVAQAYLQIIFNIELLETAKTQLETTAEQVRRTKVLVSAGSLPLADQYEILAQQATDEANIVTRENELELSKLQLMQLLQLAYDPGFSIVIPDIDVDLAPLDLDSEKIYDIALLNQPFIAASNLRVEAGEVGISVAKGAYMPSIYAFAAMDTRYIDRDRAFTFSDQLENNLGQNIGFQLNVPIFNNFRIRQSVQNATIARENAELNSIDARNNLREQVEQAYLNAKAALKSYSSSQNQVEALRIAFENIEKRRNAGGVTITDYTIALNNLTAAESDMIRAKFDYIFTRKILDFYQGKQIDL
ncbi:MAG: TolC family protein [Fulvivirga sp.]